MKIALQTYASARWMAGLVIFEDLLAALHTLSSERPHLALIRWSGTTERDYGHLPTHVDSTITAPYPSASKSFDLGFTHAGRARWIKSWFTERPRAKAAGEQGVLKANGVDCSFSVVLEGRSDWSVPVVVLVFDFQHRHLPELFDAEERAKRDQVLMGEAARAALLVVMSESAKRDLETFTSSFMQVRELEWVSNIPPSVYETDPAQVSSTYYLPERFFYLPNQFWAHKNHLSVLEALRLLASRSVYPCVVCSGDVLDHRNHSHFADILQKVSRWNLREQFVILGSVPRQDVFSLMRQSIAVLNPSLFEGFGLSASEAKSLGKRALLSNLPSLREIDVPRADYFDPRSPGELAEKMEGFWQTIGSGPDLELEAKARAHLPERQCMFARCFVEIMQEAAAFDPARV